MAMALMVSVAFGQTAGNLIEKYRKLPGAEYEDATADFRKSMEENKDISKKDNDLVKKSLKKCEQVQLTLDEEQMQELESDIQSLKGYEMLFVQNDNKEANDSASILGQLWNQTFSPKYQLAVYGKVKGNTVNNLLLRWDIWGKVVLGHLDCKMPRDKILEGLFDGEMIRFEKEDDGEVVEMKDVVKEVEAGNVLFVIDGEEHPELHSWDEAKEYMNAKDFHSNQESWVVGGTVKEKYPNTDRKVVIELSDYTKEMQKYVEKGDVLFVINGKECPELRSIEAAKAYMKSNGIECYNQHWVSKDEAKRKYPNTDRKAVIEYY